MTVLRILIPGFLIGSMLMATIGCAGAAGAAAGSDLRAVVAEVSAANPSAGPIELVEQVAYGRDRVVSKFRMANGLHVILLEDHNAPLLSYQTWYGVGSRFERKGKTGIAHLFEHLMFKGTTNYPHSVFDRLFEEAGAQTNAATWLDWTFYYENLPSSQLDLAARLESDRMVNLVLTQEQLDSERDVVKNERRFRVDNDPDGQMDEELFETVFPTHPYGMPTIGYMPDLETLTLQECLDFYRTYYSPGNATLILVGDVTPRQALETVAKYYGHLKQVEVPRPVPAPEADQAEPRVRDLKLEVATEKVKIAWRIVPADHPDVYALDVVNEVLFATESSRIHRILVEDEGLASEVDGAAEPLGIDGIFLADAVMNEGKPAKAAVDVIQAELDRLGREGPSEAELQRAKNHLEAAFLRSLSTVGARATQLGSYEMTSGDFRRMFQFVDGIAAVTADEVKRVTARYLTAGRASIIYGRPR